MGFPRITRPKSMFKRRHNKGGKRLEQIDDSGRTCTSEDDSIDSLCDHHDQDSAASASASVDELDECIHIPQGTRCQDEALAAIIIQEQLSHRQDSIKRLSTCSTDCSSSISTGKKSVTFVDEHFGLTPRHVVTSIHYRPLTLPSEKSTLYYSDRDFEIFEQEDLMEKITKEIQRIETTKRLQKEFKNLKRGVEMQCDFCE